MTDVVDIEWVVGRLYGNLLARNADQEGFDHYCKILREGAKVRDIVVEMMLSEEFREKFIYNDTPNEIARKLVTCLLGERVAKADFVRTCAQMIVTGGLPTVVRMLATDYRYSDYHGEFEVPRYA